MDTYSVTASSRKSSHMIAILMDREEGWEVLPSPLLKYLVQTSPSSLSVI